jgi:hypothetical protein
MNSIIGRKHVALARWIALAGLLALSIPLASCSTSSGEAVDQGIVATFVEGTLQVRETQDALASQIAETQAAASQPTQTTTATALPPTETSTVTPPPTATSTSAPSATPIPGDWAAFIKDVSIPDGTTMDPEETFTKVWRLKNIGSERWTKDYALVFVSGVRMGAPKVNHLARAVDPGETIDLSVDMTAPLEPGKYTGYWALRNENGGIFGIGPEAEDYFWVQIRVQKELTRQAYDFDAAYCEATWRSGSGALPCPGAADDPSGSVVLVQDPVMEDGKEHNGNALLLTPEHAGRGYISGQFPAFEVKKGDHFRMTLSCREGAKNCDIIFRLNYQIGSKDVETFYEVGESFDRKVTWVDVDLSELAGKDVKFILMVRAGRDYVAHDAGLLLNPGIWR